MLVYLPDMAVEVETNGTIVPPAPLDIRIDQHNVSPKLAHSGNPAELALKPVMLERWATDPRAAFKFVIAEPAHLDQVQAPAQAYVIPADRIWLMPEGTTSAALRKRMEWFVPLCVEHGYRLSDRLQIRLFDNTRGT